MSISERFFKKLEQRKNWQEIHYYMVRCEFNATIGGRKPTRSSSSKPTG